MCNLAWLVGMWMWNTGTLKLTDIHQPFHKKVRNRPFVFLSVISPFPLCFFFTRTHTHRCIHTAVGLTSKYKRNDLTRLLSLCYFTYINNLEIAARFLVVNNMDNSLVVWRGGRQSVSNRGCFIFFTRAGLRSSRRMHGRKVTIKQNKKWTIDMDITDMLDGMMNRATG